MDLICKRSSTPRVAFSFSSIIPLLNYFIEEHYCPNIVCTYIYMTVYMLIIVGSRYFHPITCWRMWLQHHEERNMVNPCSTAVHWFLVMFVTVLRLSDTSCRLFWCPFKQSLTLLNDWPSKIITLLSPVWLLRRWLFDHHNLCPLKPHASSDYSYRPLSARSLAARAPHHSRGPIRYGANSSVVGVL